jgi:hypothetical protein
MKTTRSFKTVVWVLFLSVGMSADAWAQGGPPAGAGSGATVKTAAQDELAALDQFLGMNEAELSAVQKAVAKVQAMSPAERAKLRAALHTYRCLPESKRQQLRCEWKDATEHREWSERMRAKTADERTAMQTELQALPPEARAARRQYWLKIWRDAEPNPAPAN